jgi:hypothetical protein
MASLHATSRDTPAARSLSSFQEGIEEMTRETPRIKGETDAAFGARRKDIILARRGVFRWLPVACSNDLVHGSWYYVWGSVLCVVIPVFPLLLLFEEVWTVDDAEEDEQKSSLPRAAHASVYGMLIVLGVLYVGPTDDDECHHESV